MTSSTNPKHEHIWRNTHLKIYTKHLQRNLIVLWTTLSLHLGTKWLAARKHCWWRFCAVLLLCVWPASRTVSLRFKRLSSKETCVLVQHCVLCDCHLHHSQCHPKNALSQHVGEITCTLEATVIRWNTVLCLRVYQCLCSWVSMEALPLLILSGRQPVPLPFSLCWSNATMIHDPSLLFDVPWFLGVGVGLILGLIPRGRL